MRRSHVLLVALSLLAGCSNRPVPAAPPDGSVSPDLEPDLLPCPLEELICHPSHSGSGMLCVCREPKPDAGPLVPLPGTWSCNAAVSVCHKTDDNKGLPQGGGTGWKCHLAQLKGVSTWVCVGLSASTPPGGNGWVCTKVRSQPSGDLFRCQRSDGQPDQPPQPGPWVCVKGSIFGGAVCYQVPQQPKPPSPLPGPCLPGQRMWCDGLLYSGWGQVECDPATGMWKSTMVNGKQMIDCSEALAGGKRPDTYCACYHTYFNPTCCQRADCIVPQGSGGQLCQPSAGKLCDACMPQKPECVEPGARCLVSNSHETFCGRDCAGKACPGGYTCMLIKLKVGTSKQCVPQNFSCYF